MRIRYAPRAIKNLNQIREYISKDNPEAAWVVASFVRRAINTLKLWPYQGRATERENVRRLVVTNYPYVVYYTVRKESVIVLNVLHTSRNH